MYALLRNPKDEQREVLFLQPSAWFYGLLFLVLAGVFLYVALDPDNDGEGGLLLRSILLSCVFALAGGACLSLVGGVTFDRSRGRIRSWWSFFGRREGRFFQKDFPLDGYDVLTIAHEIHQHRQKIVHAYPCRLRAEELVSPGPLAELDVDLKAGTAAEEELSPASNGPSTLPFALASFSKADRAWRLGRELAEFLELGLEDESMGPTLRRDAEEVPMSLVERTRHRGMPEAPTERPTEGHMRIEHLGEGLRAVLPPGGLRSEHSLAVLVGAVLTILLMVWLDPLGAEGPSSGLPAMAFYLFLNLAFELLPLGLTILGAAVAENRMHVLVAHPEKGLEVTSRLFGLSWSRSYPIDLLEEIELLPAGEDNPARGRLFPHDPALMLRDKDGARLLGHGLSYPELEWLRYELIRSLVGTDADREG